MEAAGIAAHINDCAVEKGVELFFFCVCEIPDHLGFRFPDGVVDLRDELPAPWQKMDPFAPAVGFVGAKSDEIFLLQPGQQAGNRGVAQVEFFFDVPGAGRTFPVGDVAQNGTLGGGQIEVHQSLGHALVGTPVKNPDIVAEVSIQKNHLQNKNVASYILYYHSFTRYARGNGKVYQLEFIVQSAPHVILSER